MKKLCCVLLAGLLLASLAACKPTAEMADPRQASAGDAAAQAEGPVTIQLVCESDDIYQVFYTAYLEGEAYTQGGWADLDGGPLTPESDTTAAFPPGFFEGGDLSTLSMDFSPYGPGDTSEIATTQQVAIPAQPGGTYTVVLSGDESSGFVAQLQ